MFALLKKITTLGTSAADDQKNNNIATRTNDGAKNTLAELGLDPSILSDDPFLDNDRVDADDDDPAVETVSSIVNIQSLRSQANKNIDILDLEAIHRDLLSYNTDSSDHEEEVELNENEIPDLEEQLAQLLRSSSAELNPTSGTS